jgi:hypothetical protein
MGGTVGKQANLLLRWKMNVPETKATTNFFEKKRTKTKQSFKYVKDEGSRGSYLQILHVSNTEDETQTDGKKLLPFTSEKPKKDFFFCSLGFSSFTVACLSFLFSFFFHSDERIKEKKPLCSPAICVFTPCLCCVFLFFL